MRKYKLNETNATSIIIYKTTISKYNLNETNAKVSNMEQKGEKNKLKILFVSSSAPHNDISFANANCRKYAKTSTSNNHNFCYYFVVNDIINS